MVRIVAAVTAMVVLSTGAAFAATLGGTAAGDDRLKDRSVYGGGGSDHVYGGSGSDNLYSGPGNDFISSADDGAADYVDCGDGHDTVKRGSDTNLDRFVGCEEFVN
jgi:Ca2+-binding RTX toxin-like protein